MKYIFIAPDNTSFYLQYVDFKKYGNTDLILIENTSRRLAKVLTTSRTGNLSITKGIASVVLRGNLGRIKPEERICFIVYSRVYESFGTVITNYLRKAYKNCIVCVYFGDLMEAHKIDMDSLKADVDLVATFDQGDAKRYDIDFIQEPFSSTVMNHKKLKTELNPYKWDVTFVGSARDRVDKVMGFYYKLKEYGLSCDFHITNVDKSERIEAEDIAYEPLDFLELLQHVVSSKCVLEIMQSNGVAPTVRYPEAMLFEKNLLTDCKILNTPERIEPNIFYVRDADDLTEKKMEEIQKPHTYDKKQYIRFFSANKMVRALEERIL